MITMTIRATGQTIRTGLVIDRETGTVEEINQVAIDGKWVEMSDCEIDGMKYIPKINLENTK